MEVACPYGISDRDVRYAEISQLGSRDDPMLPPRKLGNGLELRSPVSSVSYGYISHRGGKFAPRALLWEDARCE